MRILSYLNTRISDKAGLPPGTLTYIGEHQKKEVAASLFRYNEAEIAELTQITEEDWHIPEGNTDVYWLNVDGVHDTSFIEKIGTDYKLHPLMLEDIVNTTQRPKIEIYENGIHVVLQMITYHEANHEIDAEQVSMFLGNDYVITFQEKFEDVFDSIRKRLNENQGFLRKKKADYLFYALIDVIVSNYFIALQGLEDKIDALESKMYKAHTPDMLKDIQKIKSSLIFLRKYIFPLRDVVNQMLKEREQPLFEEKTKLYLRDMQGQLSQVTELVEMYREIVTGLYELHFALNGERMNEIMKVLTVVSSIFIPLTFISGIYGMNFQYMPELAWHNGYFIALGIMGSITITLLFLFKKQRWL